MHFLLCWWCRGAHVWRTTPHNGYSFFLLQGDVDSMMMMMMQQKRGGHLSLSRDAKLARDILASIRFANPSFS